MNHGRQAFRPSVVGLLAALALSMSACAGGGSAGRGSANDPAASDSAARAGGGAGTPEEVVAAYLDASWAGDSMTVCALAADELQTTLVDVATEFEHAPAGATCAEAVTAMGELLKDLRPSTPPRYELKELVNEGSTVTVQVDLDDSTEVVEFVLHKQSGRWLVASTGWTSW